MLMYKVHRLDIFMYDCSLYQQTGYRDSFDHQKSKVIVGKVQ
jgi:hypothetical protein